MRTTEEYLRDMRNMDFETFLKREKKRSAIVAIVLMSAPLVSIVFLGYAFVQKSEASKARTEAVQSQAEVVQLKAELDACRPK